MLFSLGVWTHGDFVSIHPITKQLFFQGRADGVLNPSGVRFGSSEIYQVIESVFSNDVEDSLCVGQRRPSDNDERVILFLKMKPNAAFSTELARRVRAAIRKRLSARHVPSYVFPTPEIPVSSLPDQRGLIYEKLTCRLNYPGDSELQEGGAACEKDYIRDTYPAIQYTCKP